MSVGTRRRIAYLTSGLPRSGPIAQLFELVRGLDRELFDPLVITISPEKERSRWAEFVKQSKVVSLDLSPQKSLFSGPAILTRQIESLAPDLIHSQGFRADSIAVRASLDIPHIATVRNFFYEDYPMLFGRVVGHTAGAVHLRMIRKADAAVVCSEYLAERYANEGIVTRTIHNGVRVAPLIPQEKRKARSGLAMPEDAVIFVCVGALIPRKAVDLVVRAFKRIARAQGNVLLYIVGEGKNRKALEKVAADDPRISFRGWVDDPRQYYRAADRVVSAALSEGLPNVILEALAEGAAVVLSDIRPHREIAVHAGEACSFFFAGSDEQLYGLLKNVIEERKSGSMDERSRPAVKERFSAERMVKEYQALYGDLLERSLSPGILFSERERVFARHLERTPYLKGIAKGIYQRGAYLRHRRGSSFSSKYTIKALGKLGKETFFGYYDKRSWSKDGNYMLWHEAEKSNIKVASAEEPIHVVLGDHSGRELARVPTFAYNWQQASRAQWLSNELFVFNDLDMEKGAYIARVFDRDRIKEVLRTPFPVQDSCEAGYFLSIDPYRLTALCPEYGYPVKGAYRACLAKAPGKDGIWKVDSISGQAGSIYTYDRIFDHAFGKKTLPDRCAVNHLMIDPSGKRFVFIARQYGPGGREDVLMLGDKDGEELRALSGHGMISHYCWVDERKLLGFLRGPSGEDGYYLVDMVTGEHTGVRCNGLSGYGDGHPHVFGEWFVTDTYPDKARMQHLLLCNWRTGEVRRLGKFFHGFKYSGESRCDLHPQFGPSGKSVLFDSVFTGRRKRYIMELE